MKTFFTVIIIFLASCSINENKKNYSWSLENTTMQTWITEENDEKKIIIWPENKNLTNEETQVWYDIFWNIFLDFRWGKINLYYYWDYEEEWRDLTKDLKIQKIDKLPYDLKLNLDSPTKCNDKEETYFREWNNYGICQKNTWDYSEKNLEKYYSSFPEDWQMWAMWWGWLVYSKRLFDKMAINTDELIGNDFEDEDKDIKASFKQYKNNLLIDYYKNWKYLSSKIFLVNKVQMLGLIVNLENPILRKSLETLVFPLNYRILIWNENTNLSDKEEKIKGEYLKEMSISHLSSEIAIITENKELFNKIKIQKLNEFPHWIKLNMKKPLKCDQSINNCGFSWEDTLTDDKIYSKNFALPSHEIEKETELIWYEIWFQQYKNNLIINFYKDWKYKKSIIYLYTPNWIIDFIINLENPLHKIFLENYSFLKV